MLNGHHCFGMNKKKTNKKKHEESLTLAQFDSYMQDKLKGRDRSSSKASKSFKINDYSDQN